MKGRALFSPRHADSLALAPRNLFVKVRWAFVTLSRRKAQTDRLGPQPPLPACGWGFRSTLTKVAGPSQAITKNEPRLVREMRAK
jgi:hypothetical protein